MKKIRIGCGAGCSFDRIEPVEELIEFGNLDYLVFECLAERTMSDNMLKKLKNPKLGYTPMLKERMERLLKKALTKNIKIITNMGASNVNAAVEVIKEVALSQGIGNFKIGILMGDDITSRILTFNNITLLESKEPIDSIEDKIISANVYLGHDGIKELLDQEVDMVLTGRVADVSLFTAPILHEFNWNEDEFNKRGQAILLGHLLECGGQITGGYFADPGYKDVENLHKLGMPIAEINQDGEFIIFKVDKSGGEISTRVCKEQLLYEIKNPREYITPDGIVDFSDVSFEEIGKDKVKVSGGRVVGYSKEYKVNIGYNKGFIGIGEISFGGRNSLEKARLCKKIVEGRLEIVKPVIDDISFDFVGYSSLFGEYISNELINYKPIETRLRMIVRGDKEDEVNKAVRELDFMYTNGPSGSSGISVKVDRQIGIDNILVPRDSVKFKTKVVEVL